MASPVNDSKGAAARNVLRYRGYRARIDLDADSGVFSGTVLGVAEPIVFHGGGLDELRADFEFAIDHYLDQCARLGQKPERAVSGRVLLRLPPDLHAAASLAAASAGESLNEWLVGTVRARLDES